MIQSGTRNKRTDPKTEKLVVTKIALGMRYQEIYEEIGTPVSTIKKIKQRNVELLFEIRQEILKKDAQTAARIHHKIHILLERRLDRALAGKEEISIKDLVALDKEMFRQTQVSKNDPSVSENNQLNPQQKEEYYLALKSSVDEIDMVRLLFSKNKAGTQG